MNLKVALVLEPDFGDRLVSLAAAMPVWIIESPTNCSWVSEIRRSGLTSITTFNIKENEAPETACERILQSLDDHHNASAQKPEYEELEVMGLSLGSVSLTPFLEIGFNQFHVSPSGFLAKKSKVPS